jgi:long-subunit acyl-CoA synthetase (AMP-forming)
MKNMFITSMGRNVSPEWVESTLLRDGRIKQAVVFGEARPYAVALVHPASASAGSVLVEQAIAAANADLPRYARIRRWALLPEPLRPGDTLLTANGRPRRAAIAERYGALIDALYADVLAS